MAKLSKKQITSATVISLVSVLIVAAVIYIAVFSSFQDKPFDREKYRADLSAIYTEYNTDEAYADFESGDAFAFSRLLVNDYNGKSYGETLCAFDEENGFAVLQFETPDAAEKAYYEIQSDGMLVDTEGTAELCASEKGTIYPEGSAALGTPQYLGKYNMGSDDVVFALIDTGIMYDHEELDGRMVSAGYDFSEDGCADAYYDTSLAGSVYGHSTFIAGIVTNNTPDTVKILPYKVVPFGTTVATASSIINAINDAVSRGATVINISLTSSSSGTSFKNAIKNAKNRGVCICAAAGNQSSEINGIYPAGVDETITVSALENDFETFADFSNYGKYVDFCATGRKIVSLAPYSSDADSRYRKNSGTSFSSPYIASLCADIKTINNDMSVDDVCSVLADFSLDLGDEGRDDYYGWGMPRLAAIEYTDGESYDYKIPEGTLSVYDTRDYTADTQPWRIFADKLVSVDVDSTVSRIGDYNFYRCESAAFHMNETYDRVGSYAFYGCKGIAQATFTIDCAEVGTGAYGGIDGFVINGYQNTPAETYALGESITFNALGCKHNYLIDIVDPTETEEGYTVYTCTVCGDSYVGPYIVPALLDEGICGENLTYSFYDTGRLTIDGSGEMYDYSHSAAPWADYASDIKTLEIKSDVGRISQFAFYGCTSLAKIRCSDGNSTYADVDNVLYSKDLTELVLLPKISGTAYTMPDTVTDFSAPALLVGGTAVAFNSNFTADGGIVYDTSGNIICALPSYTADTLEISDDITIDDYAFILTPHPNTVHADAFEIDFGEYSLGYYFDGALNKREVLFETYDSSTGRQYAESGGFVLKTYNKGACGDDLEWYYDADAAVLTISGTGAMTSYSSADEVPWKNYISSVKTVVIEDAVSSLGDYAFYGASKINKLTMPLSLKASENTTVWYGCSNIKTLRLTYGTGYMDDYADDSITYYRNSPWYISRKAITSFSLDENVLYVGREAFRGCAAIYEITLSKCEKIATDAFISCTKLDKFTLTAKDCEITDWSLFAYKVGSYGMYNSPVMYAYDDSTARDYCDKFGAKFVSLGCGHSRDTALISSEIHTCCFDSVYHYHCNDCDSDFTELIPTTDGHYVSGTLLTLEDVPIVDAYVYIDGVLSAVTDADGSFIAENVKCGTHTAEFSKDGAVFTRAEIIVDESNTTGDFTIPYGDFNGDGYINGRDLGYAVINDIHDQKILDWGSTTSVISIDDKYGVQELPYAEILGFSDVAGSDYRKEFTVRIVNESNYTITAAGFIYGKQADEGDLVLENADTYTDEGNRIRIAETVNFSADKKSLTYGLSGKKSWFGIRFYMIYTNGVSSHTFYSDVYRYSYD